MTDNVLGREAESLNIMNFKLTNGDDIVALVNRNDRNESYILVEGALLLNKYFENNSYSFNFEEWTPLAEDHITMINKSNIVSYCPVNTKTKTSYLRTIISLYSDQLPPEDSEGIDQMDDMDDNTTIH